MDAKHVPEVTSAQVSAAMTTSTSISMMTMKSRLYFVLADDGSGMIERSTLDLAGMKVRWPTSSVVEIKDGEGLVASDFVVRFIMGQYILKEDSSEVQSQE